MEKQEQELIDFLGYVANRAEAMYMRNEAKRLLDSINSKHHTKPESLGKNEQTKEVSCATCANNFREFDNYPCTECDNYSHYKRN